MTINKRNIGRGITGCVLLVMTIFALAIISLKMGSIDITYRELFEGLYIEYDQRVAIIYDLRLPRILVSIFGGAALSCSGLLLQAVLKNPLADPGIIGISGGASLFATIIAAIFPTMYFATPVFAFVGGLIAFMIIYSLSWKGTLDPVRIILVGIAVSAVFAGLQSVLGGMSNSNGVSVTVSGLAQLQWSDVKIVEVYSITGLILALLVSPACNVLALEDNTVKGVGININLLRVIISAIAVFLVSGITSVVGIIGFLALIVPHMARKIVGSDHRLLVPFCILLGALVLLVADTVGRLIIAPYEIPASVIMSIIGGPVFIILLRRGGKYAGH